MCSKKKSLNKTSNYAIYSNKDEKKENFVGKVRSNFLGTEFLFYDTGVNPKDSKVFGD
jgi:tubby-related protein 1